MISGREDSTQRIAALDARASALGLKPGMGIADARAMHPSIEVVEAEPEADRRLLENIAGWCGRYTPLVAIEGVDGLFLDITGCAHLFGGERGLMEDLLRRLRCQGFCARAGIASTAGAAWAAARFHGGAVVDAGAEVALMGGLPLAALRLDSVTCRGLEGVGLRTVSSLLAAPRAPLARRFGKTVLLRLDQALGAAEEAISPSLPVPDFSVERQLGDPVSLIEDIERLLEKLAADIEADLGKRGMGATGLHLLLFRVDGEVARIVVGMARPQRDRMVIRKLFHERLARLGSDIDAGYGFDLVRLCAMGTARLEAVQADLSDRSGVSGEEVIRFADRVRARLGPQSVMRPVPMESHVPERAVRLVPFGREEDGARGTAAFGRMAERPVRLLHDPSEVEIVPGESFRWRRLVHRIVRMEGPERIAPEWWREEAETPARDYFRVEDEKGRRYWLFREAGLSTGNPRWFIQGFLA